MNRTRTLIIVIAILGIGLEAVAIALMASKRLTMSGAMPLIILGMFLAFVPIFVATRRRGK